MSFDRITENEKALENDQKHKAVSTPTAPIQRQTQHTASPHHQTRAQFGNLPSGLKSGIENLSGYDMSDVRVHYNSAKPRAVGALAYAQGNQIHLGAGQEKHLPHEAWHVVQQKQGRVQPTKQYKKHSLNDDKGLEKEADFMGAKSQALGSTHTAGKRKTARRLDSGIIQRRMGIEAELSIPVTLRDPAAVTADDRIRDFLSGGVHYDTPLSGMVNNYRKSADHGPVGTTIDHARVQLDQQATNNGFAPIPSQAPHTKPAIMEYVTDAFNVYTRAEKRIFRNVITQMATNIGTVYAYAITGTTAFAHNGTTFNYGLPPVVDWQNFATANGMNANWGTQVHGAILRQMSDQLYVQMTMGVQLRRMTKFMKKLRNNQHLASQAGLGDLQHDLKKKLVTKYAAIDADAVVGQNRGALGRSKSLKGYTALILSYIYGSYAYPNIDIAKNMVAAFCKTPLHIVQRELDTAKRPDQWTVANRAIFRRQIIAKVNQRLDSVAFRHNYRQYGPNGALLGNWRAWMREVVAGRGDSFAGTAAAPGQLIMGVAPADDHTIAPEDDRNSKTIIGGPGRPAGRSAPNQVVSGVIPVELRFIQETPRPGQLLRLVNRGISMVNSVT